VQYIETILQLNCLLFDFSSILNHLLQGKWERRS